MVSFHRFVMSQFVRTLTGLGLLFGMVFGISESASAAGPDFGQINKRTLNFFLPVNHLTLPCFMPIEIKAAYNSYANDASIFGDKWTFNHNIRVRSARNKFQITEGDGFVNSYTRE